MSFSDRLKEIRTKKGISREALAQHLGMSYHTIAKWEAGSRDPDTTVLLQLADLFNVSTDYLLGRTDFPSQLPDIEAAHRIDDPTLELPAEAKKSIQDFKEYIYKKHGIKYE